MESWNVFWYSWRCCYLRAIHQRRNTLYLFALNSSTCWHLFSFAKATPRSVFVFPRATRHRIYRAIVLFEWSNWLNDWLLTQNLAVFQIYLGVHKSYNLISTSTRILEIKHICLENNCVICTNKRIKHSIYNLRTQVNNVMKTDKNTFTNWITQTIFILCIRIKYITHISIKIQTRIRERNGKLPYKTWMHQTTTQWRNLIYIKTTFSHCKCHGIFDGCK